MNIAGYPRVNWGGGPFVTLANPASRASAIAASMVWGGLNTVSITSGKHFLRVGTDYCRRAARRASASPSKQSTVDAGGRTV